MLEEKVYDTIKKYELIKNGNTIVIGVSGGPDSMALLNVLYCLNESKRINCKLIVAHINHGIRKEADEETEYVKDFCISKNIPCYIKTEKVEELAKKQKIGTEEAGRKLRYSFFEEIAKKVNTTKDTKSPLTIRMEKFSKQITFLVIAMAILITIVLYSKGTSGSEIFLSVIALSVSAMPEGLSLALTMALTIGSNRMSKNNVIVKKLNSV